MTCIGGGGAENGKKWPKALWHRHRTFSTRWKTRENLSACGRQGHGEGRALARGALDVEPAAMAVDHVLHDREAKPGAAELAGAGGVDTVEALGESRQVRGGNAVALVAHGDRDVPLLGRPGGHFH